MFFLQRFLSTEQGKYEAVIIIINLFLIVSCGWFFFFIHCLLKYGNLQ